MMKKKKREKRVEEDKGRKKRKRKRVEEDVGRMKKETMEEDKEE